MTKLKAPYVDYNYFKTQLNPMGLGQDEFRSDNLWTWWPKAKIGMNFKINYGRIDSVWNNQKLRLMHDLVN